MADKKETKRERREDAKRRRMEELRRRQRQARMRKLAVWGVVALVIAGIVAGIMLAGRGDKKKEEDLQRLATAAGCAVIKTHPDEGATHIAPPQTVNYKTNPPTSGNHYGNTAQTGIHTAAVQSENLVHNLEHGHIAILYKPDIDGQILDVLEEVAREDPRWVLLSPSTTIDTQLAFVAWRNSQLCNSPTTPDAVKAAAKAFLPEFKNKGPEPNLPGTPQGV